MIVVMAALAQEADAFMPGMGQHATIGWLPVRRLMVDGQPLIVATTGIGKVNTAMAAARLHADAGQAHSAVSLFIEIGTAGKISAAPGDCFWLDSAIQHDYGAERPGRFVHYDPGAWPMGPDSVTAYRSIADPGLASLGIALPHARIASGDAFIECPDHARFLSDGLSADLVDMETAALAQFCARAGVDWAGIKATTDDANEGSAGDFAANLAAAARRAGRAAEALVRLIVAAH